MGLLKVLGNGEATLTRYNIYRSRPQSTLWRPASSIEELFPEFPMEGFRFRVATLPYDVSMIADVDPNPPDDEHLYTNHTGVEAALLEMAADVMVRRV